MHTVEDASRKLAVMDSQGRVWAQEMMLRVSPDHVTLLDPLSKVPGGTWGVGARSSRTELARHGELGLRDVGGQSVNLGPRTSILWELWQGTPFLSLMSVIY